jgi:hypothetical protein
VRPPYHKVGPSCHANLVMILLITDRIPWHGSRAVTKSSGRASEAQ